MGATHSGSTSTYKSNSGDCYSTGAIHSSKSFGAVSLDNTTSITTKNGSLFDASTFSSAEVHVPLGKGGSAFAGIDAGGSKFSGAQFKTENTTTKASIDTDGKWGITFNLN